MDPKNPFAGIKTYDRYRRLWGLTAAVIGLQAAVTVAAVLAELRSGVRFTSLETMIPAFLATAALSAYVLARLGVSWRGALADWRACFLDDAIKSLKYFGGYALIVMCLTAVLMLVWWLFGDAGMQTVIEPVTAKASKESLELKAAAAVSGWRLPLSALSACALAPVAEELFFRRIFYTAVRARNGFWFSAFWSGLFFALFHGAAAPLLLPVGIYFCWVYERERRLPVNIMLHAMVNVTMLFNRMIA